MGKATTTKRINPTQLAAEVGAPVSISGTRAWVSGQKTIEVHGATDAAAAAAVAAHTFAAGAGLPDLEAEFAALRAKVAAGGIPGRILSPPEQARALELLLLLSPPTQAERFEADQAAMRTTRGRR